MPATAARSRPSLPTTSPPTKGAVISRWALDAKKIANDRQALKARVEGLQAEVANAFDSGAISPGDRGSGGKCSAMHVASVAGVKGYRKSDAQSAVIAESLAVASLSADPNPAPAPDQADAADADADSAE